MSDEPRPGTLHFEVQTPLGFSVRVTDTYWEIITTIKHPMMAQREGDVIDTLQNPERFG